MAVGKTIRVLGGEVTVRLSDQQAATIRRTRLYRNLVAPLRRRLGHRPAAAPAAEASAQQGVPVFHPRPVQMPQDTPEQRALVERIQARSGPWYHTVDVGHGVRTPGGFDHAPALAHYGLPDDLTGMRCLDVATFDGFWAFEMERRGAAEVVALDIEQWTDLDLPPYVREEFAGKGLAVSTGQGFQILHELKQSRVERRICNVYDLSPEKFGTFDLVYCGDLLVHLSNPHRALQNICAVTRGTAILAEPFYPPLDEAGLGPIAVLSGDMSNCHWWVPSSAFQEKAIGLAGFTRVERRGTVDLRTREHPEVANVRAIYHASRPANVLPAPVLPDFATAGLR
jgi:tRNA (mo5U34)-methyltransferase